MSVVPERKAFEEHVKSGNATLGSVLKNYPTNSFDSGMLRVARLIRQECFRVPGVPCGLAKGERTVTSSSSRPLRDELVKLAEKSPDLKIIWIKAPKHRE